MNRRIRSIFWLMTFCIIGINAFQGYWLWTTYQLNRQQFTRTVQDALFSVYRQYQVAEASRLFAKQDRKEPQKQTRMIIHQFDSTANREQIRVIVNRPRAVVNRKDTHQLTVRAVAVKKPYPGPPGLRMSLSPGMPPPLISNLIVLDWPEGTRINLAELSKAYWAELHQRGVNARFRLDTVSVPLQKPTKDVRFNRLEIRTNQADLSNVVTTMLVPVNPVHNLFARASFETPTFYLLRRMGWLLGSSVFLLLLTTGSFLFMLSTILRQKKLSEVKNDFINNMTHELKTPIATVTAAVEALQHFGVLDDPKKTQTYLAISQNNLQRLSDLVEKVLNLAVEEKSGLALRPESINLHDMVNELIASHQLKTPKPVTFQVDIPADTTVTVDRIHFGNALNNLIDNAINYSHNQVTVHLTFQQDEQGWQLAVADNGIGIAKTYQAAIFDRFFRVPTGDLHMVKGFGLGLAYVRQVIERHGGRVLVQSEPGKGSEFLLKF